MNTEKKIIIIGGSLVGSLCALFLGKRGYQVTLVECREDVRSKEDNEKSFNLIISERGRKALSAVGIEDVVLTSSTPVYGRVLHYSEKHSLKIFHGKHSDQCVFSINKNKLNGLLLTEVEKHSNIDICFNQKLTDINFDEGTVTCLDLKTSITKTYRGDLIIGADGNRSIVRRLMTINKFITDFSRDYVRHIYLHFTVSKERGESLTPNHYHIWPRGPFTMSALPNNDNTWTLMMFMPGREHERIYFSEPRTKKFLQDTFPEAFSLVGDSLTTEFCAAPVVNMLGVQCKPYHVGKKFLIIGDAAHPIVPYCNQGMNAGFEDCFVLNDILSEKEDIGEVVQEWTARRVPEGYALDEHSMRAYNDVRESPSIYFLRQCLDQLLFKLFPNGWIPTYVSLSFSNLSYEECWRHQIWQDKVINRLCWLIAFLIMALFIYW